MPVLWLIIAVAIIAIIVGVITLLAARKRRQVGAQGPYPEGHFVSLGIATGLPLGFGLGLALGILTENESLGVALGPAMGTALGVTIGSIMEHRNKDRIRPLTAQEKQAKQLAVIVGIGALVLGFAVLGLIVLTR